jgi:hypothetical protein
MEKQANSVRKITDNNGPINTIEHAVKSDQVPASNAKNASKYCRPAQFVYIGINGMCYPLQKLIVLHVIMIL